MNIDTNGNNSFTGNENPPVYTDIIPEINTGLQPPKQKNSKALGIVAACVIVIALIFGYFKLNENVFRVQDVIDSIGVVTLDSKEDIEYAETAYNDLTNSEKKRVKNYDVLVSSRQQYDDLILDSFESSSAYSAIKSTMNSNLGEYSPKLTFDRANKALVISLSIDPGIEELLVNYPALARSSWREVTTNMNSLTSTCTKLVADYGIDVIMKLYPRYSSTLLFESTNGTSSYDILD